MRNIRCLLFVAVLSTALQSVRAQVATPEAMVQKVFATLQAKDQKAFVALYPNADQFGRFIHDIMEKTFKSEEMKQMMALDEKTKNLNVDSLIDAQVTAAVSPTAFAEMQAQFGQIFQRTIEKGEKKGVKWSEAQLTGYTIDSSENKEEGTPPVNVKTIKGVIDFTSGGQPYQLAFDKMLYLPVEKGWFGADFPQLARKGESLAPDAK
ncbi:MAG TPA: hypothetical protein VFL47_02635, partial [Flavisolibacter sp.]|nr:hypothetical protein [Flavisolibacter sp.]